MEPEADRQHSQENKPLQPSKVTVYGSTSLTTKLLCFRLQIWWLLCLGLLAFIFILSIGCLGSPRWMAQTLLASKGGILRCTDCPGHWQDGSYDEITQYICDSSLSTSDSPICTMFERLRDSGAVYVFFDLLALTMLVAWMFKLMLLLLERHCFPTQRWVPYVFPVIAVLAHLLAIAGWFGISKASFTAGCDALNSGELDLCATDAPALSIVILLLYLITAVLFIIAHCKNTSLNSPPQKPKAPNSPRFSPHNLSPSAPSPPKRFD